MFSIFYLSKCGKKDLTKENDKEGSVLCELNISQLQS